MRIALVTNNLMPPREGIGQHVLGLATRLRARGHDPFIVAPDRGPARPPVLAGIPVRRFAQRWPRPLHHEPVARHLQRWLDEGASGAELVHVHLPLFAPLRFPVRSVVTFHSPMTTDAAAIRERGLGPLGAKLLARHRSRAYEQAFLDRCDAAIAVSRTVAAELRQHYRTARGLIQVIPNGVDTGFFATEPRRLREPVVLFVGRLGYRKGLGRLLHAFAGLPDELCLRLVLVGEGPLEHRLRRLAHRLRIAPRVVFAGFQPRETVRSWLWRASCFVNPADYESGPQTLLEAMAASAPVVTTPTGLVPEFGDDPPVCVVEPDPDALATGILRTLVQTRPTAERTAAARALVAGRYDWDLVVDALLEVYAPSGQALAA